MLKLRVKRLDKTIPLPKKAYPGDAGLDLTVNSYSVDQGIQTIRTGLCVEIPEGYVGLLFPRSSVYKKALTLSNSVGVIDSGYRGEIVLKYRMHGHKFDTYSIGEKAAQLVVLPLPSVEIEEVEELSESVRGTGGFGSSGT